MHFGTSTQKLIAKKDRQFILREITGLAVWTLFEDDNAGWTVAQREAFYGAVFVAESGSLGVHNSSYARSLLDNAITYLTPAP